MPHNPLIHVPIGLGTRGSLQRLRRAQSGQRGGSLLEKGVRVMSAEISYDVYVKRDDVDSMGTYRFGVAVAHFVERENAVALKRTAWRVAARRCTSRGASCTASPKRRKNSASRITSGCRSSNVHGIRRLLRGLSDRERHCEVRRSTRRHRGKRLGCSLLGRGSAK